MVSVDAMSDGEPGQLWRFEESKSTVGDDPLNSCIGAINLVLDDGREMCVFCPHVARRPCCGDCCVGKIVGGFSVTKRYNNDTYKRML